MRLDGNEEIRRISKALCRVPTPNPEIENTRINLTQQQFIDSKKYSWASTISNITQALESKRLLEIGTAVGVSAAYIAKANKNIVINTIELEPELCFEARCNLRLWRLENRVIVHEGMYQEVMPKLMQNNMYDVIFKDAYHIGQSNINLVHHLINIKWQGTLILDDIRWSWDMLKAWNKIKRTPGVAATVDLYHIGIVVIKNNYTEKNHYKYSLRGVIPP